MSDPYRSASGTQCLRCKTMLATDDGGDLVCANGCGRWIANASLQRLIAPSWLPSRAKANPFKATPFAPAACPVCRKRLEDIYSGVRPIVSLGQCAEHGIWVDRYGRAELEAAFADAIEEYRAHAATQLAEDELRRRIAAGDVSLIKVLFERNEMLQARVERLERAVRALIDRDR